MPPVETAYASRPTRCGEIRSRLPVLPAPTTRRSCLRLMSCSAGSATKPTPRIETTSRWPLLTSARRWSYPAGGGSGLSCGAVVLALMVVPLAVVTTERRPCWTCRPVGSRYLAYHCGPRRRSTRKTWPEIGCKGLDSRDIFGTRRPEREKLAPSMPGRPTGGNPATAPNGAAKESNLPTAGLRRPAGFEDRMGHQARATPSRRLEARPRSASAGARRPGVREPADGAELRVRAAVLALRDLDQPGADDHEDEEAAGQRGGVDVDPLPALVAVRAGEAGQRLRAAAAEVEDAPTSSIGQVSSELSIAPSPGAG